MARHSLVLAVVVAALCAAGPLGAQTFVRGDVDGNGTISAVDVFDLLGHLYGGLPLATPQDARDANDNGVLEIADAVYLARFLFEQGASPPAPYPAPGIDSTPPNFPTASNGTLAFRLSDEVGCPGAPTVLQIGIDNADPVEALHFRIVYDPALSTVVSLNYLPLELILGEEAQFFEPDLTVPGVLNLGTLFKYVDPTADGIPPGTGQWLVDVLLDIHASAGIGAVLAFEFEDDPAAVIPKLNLGSVLGQVVIPTLDGGSVTVNCQQAEYLRGDANEDSTVSISDAVFLLQHLFQGGPASDCERTGDCNGDALLDVGDPVYLLMAYFAGGAPIPPPYPLCGSDPLSSVLECTTYPGSCP